jgi:eukaryotic-like serine/threonine-protein kinase
VGRDLVSVTSDFRYEIVRKIFEGGMGVVYEAHQLGAHGFVKRVAIKVIRERYASQPEFIENFIGEAKLVADLIHTNIVQTYHLGAWEGSYYICLELIRGVNLEQFCTRLSTSGRTLPMELAVFIVSRIARGLAYAHNKTDRHGVQLGIVHRDISPKNIMIAFEGDVKVTDFGIAKAKGYLKDKEGEEVAGKPEFMSPEQADFQITDKRSDIFSAGIVLSQLLTGTNIFKAPSPEASRERVMSLPIPDFRTINPGIEPTLDRILQRALSRDLTKRYQTADEFLYDLEFFIYHRGYGPTNETLGRFIRDLFDAELAAEIKPPDTSKTVRIRPEGAKRRTTSLFDRIKSHIS